MIDRFGKWQIARSIAENMGKEIPRELYVALNRVGLQAEKEMVKYIKNQQGVGGTPPWAALSEKYLAQKKKAKGISNKILIASTTMLQSITTVPGFPSVFVGVKRGKVDPGPSGEGKEDVANIAAIMEFGSKARGVPARPFIRPVMDHINDQLKNNNLFGHHIVEYLKKKYG
jgi:hypothetical protein